VERLGQAVIGAGVEGGNSALGHIVRDDGHQCDVLALVPQPSYGRHFAWVNDHHVGAEYREEPPSPQLVVDHEDIVSVSSQRPRQLGLVRPMHEQDSELGEGSVAGVLRLPRHEDEGSRTRVRKP
jgi:hypothetical protein